MRSCRASSSRTRRISRRESAGSSIWAANGVGHFIHTYVTDGDPLPAFVGEPERVRIPDDLKEFAAEIWENLDADNRISLYCRSIDLKSGKTEKVLINRYTKE